MRKYVLFLLFVALSWSAATATTLNALILKRAPRADLSFSQNYVIVSGNEFYGPFPKDTDLKIGPFGKGLQLTLQNKEGKTKKIEIPENKKIHINEGVATGIWTWDYETGSLAEETIFFNGESNELIKAPSIATDQTYYKAISIRCIKQE